MKYLLSKGKVLEFSYIGEQGVGQDRNTLAASLLLVERNETLGTVLQSKPSGQLGDELLRLFDHNSPCLAKRGLYPPYGAEK
jgi:hypothetical protein